MVAGDDLQQLSHQLTSRFADRTLASFGGTVANFSTAGSEIRFRAANGPQTYPKTKSRPGELINVPQAPIADLLARGVERLRCPTMGTDTLCIPIDLISEMSYLKIRPIARSGADTLHDVERRIWSS